MEQILTASQVASQLQVHSRTVYRIAKRGSVPGRKFGGGWRFRKSRKESDIQRKKGDCHEEQTFKRAAGRSASDILAHHFPPSCDLGPRIHTVASDDCYR
jgi:excisionase family DNA binding protein